MNRRLHEAGFSAIELLITLFVLAAFLIAGVQLYNVVISDGGASRAESRAANLAYNYLRQYSPTATQPCTSATPVSGESISAEGLVNVSATVTISCPYGGASNVSKVEASITYNNPSSTVVYATYVIDQAGGEESSVISGLVAWWKLNGNTEDTISSASGTIIGNVTPGTGADGRVNGAYSFDGSGDAINVGASTAVGSLTNSFTVSAWINTANIGATYNPIFAATRTTSANGFAMTLVNAGLRATTYGVKDYNSASATVSANTWYHVTATFNANNSVTFYINGTVYDTVTHSAPGNVNTDDVHYIGGTTPSAGGSSPDYSFNGRLDDIRIYNRVLSQDEIQTLFAEGAF